MLLAGAASVHIFLQFGLIYDDPGRKSVYNRSAGWPMGLAEGCYFEMATDGATHK